MRAQACGDCANSHNAYADQLHARHASDQHQARGDRAHHNIKTNSYFLTLSTLTSRCWETHLLHIHHAATLW